MSGRFSRSLKVGMITRVRRLGRSPATRDIESPVVIGLLFLAAEQVAGGMSAVLVEFGVGCHLVNRRAVGYCVVARRVVVGFLRRLTEVLRQP